MKPFLRGRIWWLDYTVNGVRHQQSLHTKSKKEAVRFADTITTAAHAPTFEEGVEILRIVFGKEPSRHALPLDECWDEYLRLAKATGRDALAPTTIQHRRDHLARFVKWTKEHAATIKTAEAVSGAVAAEFAAWLALQKSDRNKTPLSAKTRKNAIGNLSTIWKMLEKASPRLSNPWLNLSPRDVDGKRIEAFSREQEPAVLAAAEKVGKGWPLACLLGRWTGLRYGDVANLEWSSVDLEAGVLNATPSKTKRHGVEVCIPLAPPLAAALAEAAAKREADEPFVLPTHHAFYGVQGRVARREIRFREVLDAAGVKGDAFTFHSWRHTLRSRMGEAGVDIESAKRILGHTNDEMSRHYDHATHVEESRAAIEAAK